MSFTNISNNRPNLEIPNNVMIYVLVPCRYENGVRVSYYDNEFTYNDIKDVFEQLNLHFEWLWTDLNNIMNIMTYIKEQEHKYYPMVFNLCDGDEISQVNNYPGISVVKALEQANLIFTGANSIFYDNTTSKIVTKKILMRYGVNTSPMIELSSSISNINSSSGGSSNGGRRNISNVKYPLIVKPDVSAMSSGLSCSSVIWCEDYLYTHMNKLQSQGITNLFAEEFISGPEYTVMVIGNIYDKANIVALQPLARVFNNQLPEYERFFTFDRYNFPEGDYTEDERLNIKYYHCEAVKDVHVCKELVELAIAGYIACEGVGYARIDIRQDSRSDKYYILEINSNPGVSSDYDTSCGAILKNGNISFASFISAILIEALSRKSE